MLQRQPGLARRSALLQQLWSTTLRLPTSRPGNQLNTYEHNGDAFWLEYLKPSVLKNPLSAQQEYSNYMLQLASIESSRYGDVNQRYIATLRQAADFERCCHAGKGHPVCSLVPKESCGLVGLLVICLPIL